MKHFFPLCILLGFFSAHGQSTTNFYDYNWKPINREAASFLSEVMLTDSGFLRRDYFIKTKSLQMSGLYQDSECKKSVGLFYRFYANGQLQSLGRYREGMKHGPWLRYHFNGMLEDSTYYEDGEPVGTSKNWWPNGMLRDSIVYKPDGAAMQVSWFENGMPSSAGWYQNKNIPNGKWKYFHQNGQPSAIEIYRDGKLAEKTFYDENGQLLPDVKKVDQEAGFPGGSRKWQEYLLKKIMQAEKEFSSGSGPSAVVINFSINETGEVVDAYVSVPLNLGFDEIALKAIQSSPKWNPAISHNRAIRTSTRQWISLPRVQANVTD